MSGLSVLQQTDAHLAAARREASEAQEEADRLAALREALRAEEAAALEALARLRLAELEDGGAALGALDEAAARVRARLAERNAERRAADEALAAARAALAAAEAARDAEAARLQEIAAREEAALAASEERAAADPEHQRLAAAADAAARVAQHAAQKAEFAARDLAEKGKPYRDDPLFSYLWERGFGTPRYRAFPLVRMIDAWVARLIGFEPARRSFALLAELPDHLASHAARMAEAAEAAEIALVAHRRGLAGLDPTPAPHEDLVDEDEAVAAAQGELAAAEQRLASLAAGDDEVSREAARALERALGAQSLRELREHAARTPTREDDAIVAELEAAAEKRAAIDRALAAARAQAEAARRRLAELQRVRQDMRETGLGRTGAGWQEPAGTLLNVLLAEMLRGSLSRDGFWEKAGRGGPTRPSRGPSPWGGMGGGIPGGRTGGGFGGGGFRTGGRMGGGGFKTGGGF